MISIIKDSQKNYESIAESIVVSNLSSYLLARKKFYLYKNIEKDFEIIIRKKSYFEFFLDFEEYDFVQVKKIELNKEIKKIEVELGLDIFSVLLKYKKISEENMEGLKFQILDKYLVNFPKILKDKFYNQSIDEFIEILVKGFIFSKYKKFNFNILMNSDEFGDIYNFFKNNDQLEISLKNNSLEQYLEKCNNILDSNKDKLEIFSEFNKDNFLNNISGFLKVEKEFFLQNSLNELNFDRKYTDFKEIIHKGENIFNDKFTSIIKLVEHINQIFLFLDNIPKNIEEWKFFYKNYYIKYNSPFLEKNIFREIEEIEDKYNVYLKELRESIQNIFFNLNEKFEFFYLQNYDHLHSSQNKKGLDYKLWESKKYLEIRKKSLVIFIDCLRYDIWLYIKKIFEEKGFYCQNDDLTISSVPTVTKYCKSILYSSKKYNQLEIKDNLMNLRENFLGKNLIKIDNYNGIQENYSKGDIFLYEILDLDSFFHDIKELDMNYIEAILNSKLQKIISVINPEEYSIIIMTDHGAVKLKEEGLKSINYKQELLENNLELENHGRYVKIYGKIYDENIYKKFLEVFKNSNDFYCIDRENMKKYYLPVTETNKENYYFLIYKNNYYPKNTSEYNHGGINLDEVMIPFAIFLNEEKKYEEIFIEIKNNIIESNKTTDLEILIKNNNKLKNLNINLKYQEKSVVLDEVEGNKIIRIPLLISDRIGILKDILEIDFQVLNEIKILKIPIELYIEKNKKEELNKKLKNSRSLL